MRKIVAHLCADDAIENVTAEFEVEDDMTDDEIEKEAFQQVMNLVDWYWEEVSEWPE